MGAVYTAEAFFDRVLRPPVGSTNFQKFAGNKTVDRAVATASVQSESACKISTLMSASEGAADRCVVLHYAHTPVCSAHRHACPSDSDTRDVPQPVDLCRVLAERLACVARIKATVILCIWWLLLDHLPVEQRSAHVLQHMCAASPSATYADTGCNASAVRLTLPWHSASRTVLRTHA